MAGDVLGGDAGDARARRACRGSCRGRFPTPSGSIQAPNASRVRTTSLLTASRPSTSAGRVRLRVAARLRLGQDVRVVAPLAGHRREDVVRGPVDDPAHARDPVRRRGRGPAARGPGCRRPRRPRSAAARPPRGRPRSSSGPWCGEHVLVRGHDRLPASRGRRRSASAPARRRPASSTTTSIVRRRDQVGGRVGQQRLRGCPAAIAPRPRSGRRPPARTSGAPSDGASRGECSRSARMTSRPTVPAPITPTRRGWYATTGAVS